MSTPLCIRNLFDRPVDKCTYNAILQIAHLTYVRLLFSGVTPLHDAASNGHLQIVQLLLDKGANAIAKTDKGETVVTYLKRWREAVHNLDAESEDFYQSLIKRISAALDKAGVSVEELLIEDEQTTETSPYTRERPDFRRSTNVGLEDDEDESSGSVSSRVQNDVTDEYRNVMENLKSKNVKKTTIKRSGTGKRSALIGANEVVDDWLEDDIGKQHKKRKTNSPVKSQNAIRQKSPRKSFDQTKNSEDVVMTDDFQNDSRSPNFNSGIEQNCFDDLYYTPSTSKGVRNLFQPSLMEAAIGSDVRRCNSSGSKTSLSLNRRKTQAKLTHFGHTRHIVEPDSTSPYSLSKRSTESATSFSQDMTSPVKSSIEPTLFVDVKIDEKVYRVPVLLSQVNHHTIKWLANEAAARYAK